MRLLDYNTEDQFEDSCGSIKFEMGGYIYYIGDSMDENFLNPSNFDTTKNWAFFSRQTKEDYESGKDNWESPEWVPENKPSFKLGR